NGRGGEWERGRMGEWERGRMGEWENGRGGEWENGRGGEWEMNTIFPSSLGLLPSDFFLMTLYRKLGGDSTDD
ncbi:hypothetical protein, partial [Tychonema sp. LEGE 07196]